MSERMSNADIEDVLSSIRRLVSDDLRPGHASAPPPLARSAVPRLVLTQALRVSPDPAPAPRRPEPAGAGDTLAERLAELELLMAGQAPQFEDEIAPPATMPSDGLLRDRAGPGAPPVLAEVEAADVPEQAAEPLAGSEEGDEAPYVDADTATNVEPQTPGPEAAEGQPAEAPESWAEPLLLQDEDVLRALIRDVLREELQGVMGERVTRNLRKLIRAEVARALTARGIA